MTLQEQIQKQIAKLTPEKQNEVLDFISFLQQRSPTRTVHKRQSLKEHPAFGSWRGRKINPLTYQNTMRAEWDNRL
jgi:mRNA-degrading endonuclease RelE of RelBE toxin-antitoxin system